MAKQRYVNTKIWEDGWFSQLDQIEQLVFLYLLTNPMTNIAGCYELSKATIGRATGLEQMTLDVVLGRFERDKKVFYVDGWVVLANFIKHQNTKSPKIKKGILSELENAPNHVKQYVSLPDGYGMHTLSHSNVIKLNSNYNTNTKIGSSEPSKKEEVKNDVNALIPLFEEINPSYRKLFSNKTQRAALQRLIDQHGREKLTSLLEALPGIVMKKYAPTITTPLQLEDKMGAIKQYLAKEADNKNKIKIAFI